jgi:hypothetical protein
MSKNIFPTIRGAGSQFEIDGETYDVPVVALTKDGRVVNLLVVSYDGDTAEELNAVTDKNEMILDDQIAFYYVDPNMMDEDDFVSALGEEKGKLAWRRHMGERVGCLIGLTRPEVNLLLTALENAIEFNEDARQKSIGSANREGYTRAVEEISLLHDEIKRQVEER